ncbi:MAG: DUF169 domain-containing protein [Candidatus Omnitrophica bacterium]|nr:DUF169 domain-containing protein [Candidatus Omnitrophota bacterium]MCM8826114.1 DUF169 domain-containing protein [Candidatus Omnitrophota bacterium]
MKVWQELSKNLKETLNLELSPIALGCFTDKSNIIEKDNKVRICRAIIDAAKGKSIQISKENNVCFGASWHLGLRKINNPNIENMIKKFVVEGEKLFSSYKALDNLLSQMEELEDRSNSYFILSPMEKAGFLPQLVLFVCNPEEACRLLTLLTFTDGNMPKIKIGGSTCRMVISYPLATGEANISFYDYTSRKMCNVDRDKLIVSMPYDKFKEIVNSIENCSAGKAKIEFPQEFREFLKNKCL